MNRLTAVLSFVLAAAFGVGGVWVTACTSSSSSEPRDSGVGDSGAQDACPPPGPDCYPTPLPANASHQMIINACTDAQAFDKSPNLPLLQPCGQVPPLP